MCETCDMFNINSNLLQNAYLSNKVYGNNVFRVYVTKIQGPLGGNWKNPICLSKYFSNRKKLQQINVIGQNLNTMDNQGNWISLLAYDKKITHNVAKAVTQNKLPTLNSQENLNDQLTNNPIFRGLSCYYA